MPRKKRPQGDPPPDPPIQSSHETPPDPDDPVLPAVTPAFEEHDRPDEGLPFPIVAIGASAGGLEACTELLRHVPPATGMAFVVVQHLSPSHESMLSEILARATSIPVTQAVDNTPVEPDHVYVIPPGKNLVLGQGRLQLSPRTETRGQHRAIDHFMRSVAEEHGHRAIGVILSGTGNDGSLGIQEVKAGGGITIAQDSTAQQSSMPRSAIATGAVDMVLPPDEIGRELGRIAEHPYVRPHMAEQAAAHEGSLQRILGILRHHTGVEFSGYKRNTIARRVARRIVLHKLEDLSAYARLLQSNATEVDALFQDLLINVTSFFRNPEAYEALKTQVFPKLTVERARHDQVRVWALGCSTGEEAYSIAIAFAEYAEESGRRVSAQVFATDLNGVGIEKARTGVYAKGIAQDVSAERLRRFFVDVDGSYRVAKPIRDMCIFARQNVLSDPPFSRLDLVACRNMLIYLEPGMQQRVIPTLHYALRPNGFLWLGHSESVGTYRDLFQPVDMRNKIYEKRAGASMSIPMPARRQRHLPIPPEKAIPRRVPEADQHGEVDRLLLARYSPPSVVTDANLEVVQFRGDVSPFVTLAPGRATLALLKMVREGLMVAVRGAIKRAREDKVAVVEKNLRVRSDGGWREVEIEVIPLGVDEGLVSGFVVIFKEPGAHLEARTRQLYVDAQAETVLQGGQSTGETKKEMARLTRELANTREYLQSVIEQHEAANEELQSANEEVQSANEELQSINEELETSKEEIQSANEELATVNDELQNRNLELSQSNNDLANLLTSVNMAIVMLGLDLRIRRFTPAAERLFNLVPGDVGRSLGDLAMHVLTPDFEKLVGDVIESMQMREREVQDRQGRWYSLRVRPYRTLDNKIDGAVLVLVDIDAVKRGEEALMELDRGRNEFLAMLAHELRNPLASVSNMTRVLAEDPSQADHAREVIERQTHNMVRMVEDLLDVARVTQGKIELRLETVELTAVVRESLEATAHERHVGEQELTATITDAPLWVRGDRLRLAQVVANLLNNASKFTRRGGRIWLSLSVVAEGEAGASVAVLKVRDNGAGMDPALLPRIFELFVQGDRPDARARKGIGLGLTLARRLVHLHNGTIDAFSMGVGQGSEFTVRLPLIAAAAQAPVVKAKRRALRTDGPPRRILVVDDNVDSADSMRILFRMAGHEVEMVADGASAVATAATMLPDAILLDIGLPDMDGYEVARELRKNSALDKTLIVAVTGYGRDDDVRRSHDAGIDEHITKPIDADTVLGLILAGRKATA